MIFSATGIDECRKPVVTVTTSTFLGASAARAGSTGSSIRRKARKRTGKQSGFMGWRTPISLGLPPRRTPKTTPRAALSLAGKPASLSHHADPRLVSDLHLL
jgi:hypothetical protein